MAHLLHHTSAFVLASSPAGETSRRFKLYTRAYGLVDAHAQGVRLTRSKLRFHLDVGSRTEISMVRGRDIWRLTATRESEKLPTHLYPGWRRVTRLLVRLAPGEEVHEELFRTLDQAYTYLRSTTLAAGELELVEVGLLLQILHRLGYVGTGVAFEGLLRTDEWNEEFLGQIARFRRDAVLSINQALAHTQL